MSAGRTAFSANLGMLWTGLPLPDAIGAAARAGFEAVECHCPYNVPAETVAAALAETGLPMLSLNTRPGDRAAGEFGLAALPGREAATRAAIDEALDYAIATGTGAVHVLAGRAGGAPARATYLANLSYACGRAAPLGITVLIEPLNARDVPGYHLRTTADAAAVIGAVAAPNLKLMFDCYHVQITEGDVTRRITDLLPLIGHVQAASVPDRGPLDGGELSYAHLFAHLRALGWERPIGAEYRPPGRTGDSLGWRAGLALTPPGAAATVTPAMPAREDRNGP